MRHFVKEKQRNLT